MLSPCLTAVMGTDGVTNCVLEAESECILYYVCSVFPLGR